MKKFLLFTILIILVGLGVFFMFVLSEKAPYQNTKSVVAIENSDGIRCSDITNKVTNSSVFLCKDDKTGCEYFKYGSNGALTYRKGTCKDRTLE